GTGMDPDFREPVRLPNGTSARRERTEVRIPCQVRSEPGSYALLQMIGASGNAPGFSLRLCFHYADLELLGLVDATTGAALIQPGDRLDALSDRTTGVLIRSFPAPQLFCVQPQDRSFGLDALTRNLLYVTFEDREAGARGLPR